jgi:hypothetical protein
MSYLNLQAYNEHYIYFIFKQFASDNKCGDHAVRLSDSHIIVLDYAPDLTQLSITSTKYILFLEPLPIILGDKLILQLNPKAKPNNYLPPSEILLNYFYFNLNIRLYIIQQTYHFIFVFQYFLEPCLISVSTRTHP